MVQIWRIHFIDYDFIGGKSCFLMKRERQKSHCLPTKVSPFLWIWTWSSHHHQPLKSGFLEGQFLQQMGMHTLPCGSNSGRAAVLAMWRCEYQGDKEPPPPTHPRVTPVSDACMDPENTRESPCILVPGSLKKVTFQPSNNYCNSYTSKMYCLSNEYQRNKNVANLFDEL